MSRITMDNKMLQYFKTIVVPSLLLGCSADRLVAAEPATKNAPIVGTATTTPATAVNFRPVVKGAASVRVTGGSRGSGDATVTLDVLAPDQVGTTTQEQ